MQSMVPRILWVENILVLVDRHSWLIRKEKSLEYLLRSSLLDTANKYLKPSSEVSQLVIYYERVREMGFEPTNP